MGPLLRRTWAARGQTPAIVQNGGRHQKVSVAAALWLSPLRTRLGLYFQTLPNGYFDNWQITAFLEAMLQDFNGRFVVVWDRGSMHKGEPIRDLQAQFGDRITLEGLPAWAPTLNPVEWLWSWLKWQRLSNFTPHNVNELNQRVIAELTSKQNDQAFLRSLFQDSELPLPRTLLF